MIYERTVDTVRRIVAERIVHLFQQVWRFRGFAIRIAFCWAIGAALPFFDEVKQFDLRLSLRGSQESTLPIVLVNLEQSEWSHWHGSDENWLRSLKEFNVTSDSYFWRPMTWQSLLQKILAQNPRVIGVAMHFSPQLPRASDDLEALKDPRVLWAGLLDSEGRPVLPITANSYGYNVALMDLREDEDRILRRFSSPLSAIPHMALRLAESESKNSLREANSFLGDTRLINFLGSKSFTKISAVDILRGRIEPNQFTNKIVIIGANSNGLHRFRTPVGEMSRAQVIAHVVDNLVEKRWIERSSVWMISLYMALIVILVAAAVLTYPQSVASVFLIWLALGTTALSIWVFDTWFVWIPALSPLVTIAITYIVFISYQLSRKENQTWRLEQERHLQSEVEALRNNFVSLISHDLKTPIAKIQAICDRLLTGTVDNDTRDGLSNLRKESTELHRYIHSILQVSRLEANRTPLRKEPVDLNEIVEKVIEILKPLADDKRQSLHVDLEPLFSIEIDPVLIHEVILNLLENAIKYTPNDGSISVQTTEVNDRVYFSVLDNGPGISSEDQTRIFEKFFRGNAHQTQIKGTGLGLYLVKYFIELHGGEVYLETELGKGTKVGFWLPLQESAADEGD